MAEYVLIQMPDKPDSPAAWMVLYEGGLRSALPERGELANAVAMAAGRRVVLIVPGEDVLLTEVVLPAQKRHKILRVVPYALEDQVAGDVENLHFAVGPELAGESVPVAVVERARMTRWLDQAGAAGLSPDMLVPDCLLVPADTAGWSAVLDGERALVRTGPYAAFSVDRDSAEDMLSILIKRGDGAPAHLTQYACNGALPLVVPGELQTAQAACDNGALALFCKHFRAGSVINLLQGDFSRTERISQLWRPWRMTAALAVVALVLAAVRTGLEYRALYQEHRQLSQRIEQTYREIFPGAKRVVNPKAQMQQNLLDLRKGKIGNEDRFLELLSLCGGVLKANTGVQVQGASYREGRMDLDITANDLQVLDQLKQQLTTAGQLEVEILSATSDENQRVQSRLRLRKAGA